MKLFRKLFRKSIFEKPTAETSCRGCEYLVRKNWRCDVCRRAPMNKDYYRPYINRSEYEE